jgi:hypothetical protein
VVLTDVEHPSAIRRRADSRKLKTLLRSPKIFWADDPRRAPDGWPYPADSAMPAQMPRSMARVAARAAYAA